MNLDIYLWRWDIASFKLFKIFFGSDSIAGVYLSAIEYLGKEGALQKSVKSQVARTLDKNKINELKYASQNRAAWVRKVVADILQKVSLEKAA